MQIKNKYYPYPVIAPDNDSYENCQFLTDANYECNYHNIKFLFEATLNDKMLLKMISEGKVKYAHHIECQQTCYRKLILTDEPNYTHVIHENVVNGLTQVCSFLMADQDITGYSNPSFGRDYRGFKFDLDRGCILAIGNQINLIIDKEKDDLAKTSSIFSIRKNLDPTNTELQVSTSGEKIVVLLPEKTCNQYLNLSNNATFLPVLYSMVILPALMHVLSEIKEAATKGELYNYDELRWYRGLRKTAEKLSIEFDETAISSMNVYRVAQLLLDEPVVKALDNICSGEGDDFD